MGKKTLIGILLFAFILRFIGINSRSIWYDEAFSILFAEKGSSAILSGTLFEDEKDSSAEEHPPLYYFILSAWFKITYTSILTARILSIILSMASLALLHLITSHLFNIKTSKIAIVIFSILPFQIHFAQEIRMYAMLTFFLLLATYSYLKAKTENWKWWIVFSLSTALAQYTHNLAVIYLIPLALTPLFQKDWKALRSLIIAVVTAVILYTPWLVHLPAQISKVNAQYWVEKPDAGKIFTLMLFYLPHLPLPNSILMFGLLFALLIITLAFFQMYLGMKNKIPNANYGLWLAYLAFVPPLLLWVVSQFIPVYIERALLPSHAIFCIWLAWALTETKLPRIIQNSTFIMIFICAGTGYYQHLTYKDFPYAPFADVNQSIETRLETDNLILHSSKLSYLPMFYFDKTLPQGFIIDPPNSNVDTLAPTTREVLNLKEYTDIEQATENAERIWFVIYQNSIDEYTIAGQPTHPHLMYLNDLYILEEIKEYYNLRVYLYTKK